MAALTPTFTPSKKEEEEEEEEEATREWAELPRDALLSVLHKLDQVDVLMGAGQVCRPWRAAARDEPELWRSVEVRPSQNVEVTSRALLCGLARAAVRRAAGQCEAFSGEGAVDDSVLSLLADAAPALKRLRIIYGVDDLVVDERLRLTITRFTLLEELELAVFTGAYPETCEAIGRACPLLKRLRLNRIHFFKWRTHDIDLEAAAIAATMRGLRSLQLFASPLTDRDLTAILDACAHLESLDIRQCFNVAMGADAIRARSPGIQTLRLPEDSTDDYIRRTTRGTTSTGTSSSTSVRTVARSRTYSSSFYCEF
uniref:Uncharacterized protein n=1 Tax=Avena sativa TaxID=4498 RepID=A0ACD5UQX0_AVESA